MYPKILVLILKISPNIFKTQFHIQNNNSYDAKKFLIVKMTQKNLNYLQQK